MRNRWGYATSVLYNIIPTRIRIPDRIIHHIRIPIQRQGVPRAGDEDVGLGESSQYRIMPACVVNVQSNLGFEALAGV